MKEWLSDVLFPNAEADFAGLFDIRSFTRNSCKITEGYMCLFVCFSTTAIHLGAVSDISTPDFLVTFGRFMALRGFPSNMYSENGRKFLRAVAKLMLTLKFELRNWETSRSLNMEGLVPLTWVVNGRPKWISFKIQVYVWWVLYTLIQLAALSNDVDELIALNLGNFLIGAPNLSLAKPALKEICY